MSGPPVAPVQPAHPGRLERTWRWTAYAVLPFAVAFTVALSVTGYLQARGQASPGTAAPAGPAGAPTLAQMMNLSPVPEHAAAAGGVQAFVPSDGSSETRPPASSPGQPDG